MGKYLKPSLGLFLWMTTIMTTLPVYAGFKCPWTLKHHASPKGTPGPWSAESLHWINQIKIHTESDSEESRLYSVMRFATLNSKRYSIDQRTLNSINRFLLMLEAKSFEFAFDSSIKNAERNHKRLNFFGLNHLFQKKVFDVDLYAPQSHAFRGIPTILNDLTFTIIPTVLAMARPLRYSFDEKEQQIFFDLFNRIEDDLRANDLESLDLISLQLVTVLKKLINEKPSRSWYYGRMFAPFFYVIGYSLVVGNSPISSVATQIQENVPYSYRLYKESEFFHDIEQTSAQLQTKRNLLVVDEDIYRVRPFFDGVSKENLKTSTKVLNQLNQTSSLDIYPITTMADLMGQPLDEYDNIIILGHGHPDEFARFNLSTAGLTKMKPGANLILFSCSIGQKGSPSGEEKWVRFSRGILNGGRAFASTQDIWYEATGKAAEEIFAFRNSLPNRVFSVVSSATKGLSGISFAEMTISKALDGLGNEFYWEPKGIRVYDSKTDKVEFHPSVPFNTLSALKGESDAENP